MPEQTVLVMAALKPPTPPAYSQHFSFEVPLEGFFPVTPRLGFALSLLNTVVSLHSAAGAGGSLAYGVTLPRAESSGFLGAYRPTLLHTSAGETRGENWKSGWVFTRATSRPVCKKFLLCHSVQIYYSGEICTCYRTVYGLLYCILLSAVIPLVFATRDTLSHFQLCNYRAHILLAQLDKMLIF